MQLIQAHLRKTKVIYFVHFKAYVVIILIFNNIKVLCETFS